MGNGRLPAELVERAARCTRAVRGRQPGCGGGLDPLASLKPLTSPREEMARGQRVLYSNSLPGLDPTSQ